MTDAPPRWFVEALADRPHRFDLDVDGRRIAVRAWGDATAPAIVLVHGAAAHAGWWDHVAPLLARTHHVLALDLGGHGDSDRLATYGLDTWADEVAAVVGTVDRPLLVGHSLGGHVAYRVAARGLDLSGLLVVDAEVPDRPEAFTPPPWRPGPHRLHPDRETVTARFRTLPSTSTAPPYVLRHVAEGSVTQVDGGWTWKFDPGFFDHDRIGIDDIHAVACPSRLVVGADGLVPPAMAARVAERLGSPGPPVTVAGSGHHVPLDQPLALVDAILAAAADWSTAPTPTLEDAP